MEIKNDKQLDIATGYSRKAKTWKNKTVLWSAMLDRLSDVTRTPETLAEYKAMGRERQAEIKDVGGFVGGYCNDGRRTHIRHRSLLCLDADFADRTLWDDWLMLYGNAAAVYSTHKHTPDKPRLRLVVPLARNVDPEEYQAIGRRVAATLGIDQFDDTSYQPQRLMYWPSCSQDGSYVFDYHDGIFLDPDVILSTYHDWRDVTAWPISSREADVVKREAKKQKDPLSKNGLVGSFCRAYSIDEAIEAYVPSYQPCGAGRYTYTEGSTSAGVITYDGKYSYSHHATDPASMQLCNAWDLVRLHKFGILDADIDPSTPAGSRPSYKAMVDLAAKDPRVKAQVVEDRLEEAGHDFSDPVEDNTDWRSKIKLTDKGGIASCIENVVLILNGDPDLAGCLGYNDFSHNIMAIRSLPWRSVDGESQWTDSDDAGLRYYLEREYGLTGKDKIFDGVNVVAMDHKYHPVKDFLAGCTWDGVLRMDTLLVDYLGAEDSPYTRAVTRKALVAAVARIYNPGCKYDYMLTIRGRQGIGKSALIAKLGGDWFSDSFTTLQGKEAYEQVLGVWIMEVGELAGMRKAEAETIKLYISKQIDRFRPAYGRRTQEYPRQCIFIGTTNEEQFLRDTTGNRRFWVVDTPNDPKYNVFTDLTPDTVKLIWAEALQAYNQGEPLYLSRDLEAAAREIQESYEEDDANVGIVEKYLDTRVPANWADMDLYARRMWLESGDTGTVERSSVSRVEIWAEALGQNPDRLDRYASREVGGIMSRIRGWRYMGGDLTSTGPYGRQRYYRRVV